jgi:hypothetical protein
MSLLRNFSPGGEPDDDDELLATAQPDEAAPSGDGQAPGTARYAFATPAASAAPAPATVVTSEVVTEPDDLEEETWRDDFAEEAERDDRVAGAEETAPAPVAGAPVPEAPPVPSFTPAPEAFTPEAAAPEALAYEATAPDLAPVPDVQTAPVPVPSPRATDEDEDEAGARPSAMPAPDLAAPLLGDTAELHARWQRLQGDFVDDPRAAVSGADDLVEQTAQALAEALRLRQRQLRAAWGHGAADGSPAASTTSGAPDTEELRLMMQRYRALFNQLCQPS